MPCRSEYPEEPMVSESSYKKLREELDKVTDLLCRLCRTCKNNDKDEWILEHGPLGKWWVKHEEFDRKREAEENAVIERERKKQSVLNKLSAEEKKLLGL